MFVCLCFCVCVRKEMEKKNTHTYVFSQTRTHTHRYISVYSWPIQILKYVSWVCVCVCVCVSDSSFFKTHTDTQTDTHTLWGTHSHAVPIVTNADSRVSSCLSSFKTGQSCRWPTTLEALKCLVVVLASNQQICSADSSCSWSDITLILCKSRH